MLLMSHDQGFNVVADQYTLILFPLLFFCCASIHTENAASS